MEVVFTKVGFFGFLLGLVLGSFVLVLAERSLTKQSFWGRSYCPHCKKKLRWYDLFPILSFIILRGRCRYCGDKIAVEYLLAEVVMGLLVGLLFAVQFQNFHPSTTSTVLSTSSLGIGFSIFIFELVLKTFFITILAVLFITDLKKMLIPDRIIVPAIKIGLASILVLTITKIGYLYYFLSQSTVGRYLLPPHSDYFQRHALLSAWPFLTGILMAILIGGFFMGLIIITKGKGMGGGDVKLGAFIGLMLGFPQSLLALVLSFILGALLSLVLIVTKKKHFGQSIPFGPFLVLGSLISLFWGNQIIDWYLRLGS